MVYERNMGMGSKKQKTCEVNKMKQLKTEKIQMPQIAKAGNWTDLFNALFPKVSGVHLENFVELKVTSTNIEITTMVEE